MTAVSALLGAFIATSALQVWFVAWLRRISARYRRLRDSNGETERKLAATEAVSLEVFAYCYRCEGILMNLAYPGRVQPELDFQPLAREIIDSRPPIIPEMAAIDAGNWAELERIRKEGPKNA